MATNPNAQVRVKALRGFYAADLLPDGKWTVTASPKAAGSIFPMRYKEAVEAQVIGKAQILKDEPAPAPPAPAMKAKAKD